MVYIELVYVLYVPCVPPQRKIEFATRDINRMRSIDRYVLGLRSTMLALPGRYLCTRTRAEDACSCVEQDHLTCEIAVLTGLTVENGGREVPECQSVCP